VNVAYVAGSGDLTEGGPSGMLQFTRYSDTGEPVDVFYSVGGSATSGVDFTALSGTVSFAQDQYEVDVPVYVTDDSIAEFDEAVVVTLLEDPAYQLDMNDQATIIIHDNDTPLVQVETINDTTEGSSQPGKFTLTRMGDKTTSITVNYLLTGTADNGTDYVELSGSVEIPAGESTADVLINATHDALYDPDETVILTIDEGNGYIIDTPNDTATVTIYDDAEYTFILNSIPGAVWYDLDWTALDSGNHSQQQLALTNFALQFAGQTYTSENATITGAVAVLDYNATDGSFDLSDIQFTVTLDTPVNGIKKIVADAGMVTGYDVTDQQIGDPAELVAAGEATLVLDFADMYISAAGPIHWNIRATVGGQQTGVKQIEIPTTATPGSVCAMVEAKLKDLGLDAEADGTILVIRGTANNQLSKVEIITDTSINGQLPAGPLAIARIKAKAPARPVLDYRQ